MLEVVPGGACPTRLRPMSRRRYVKRDVVQAGLDADADAAWEVGLREAARIAARADELQALRELGTLERAEPPASATKSPGAD
ncbi:hypothetical protein [Streptomyces sp. MMG1121]|uniref:hypothetical protein n=1 Tax=Streptomyces sp. MMG1121 TaxID=1415544 RepID=UPI00131DE172|nr:hypothetical protein [Streptomyces sp. MMG1121]